MSPIASSAPGTGRNASAWRSRRGAVLGRPRDARRRAYIRSGPSGGYALPEAGLTPISLHQRQHPQRAAAAVDDLERRGDDHRSRRRELVEIAQAGEAELSGSVHQGVRGERGIERAGLAGVRAHGLDTHAENLPLLDQKKDGLLVEARAVGAVRADVQKILRADAP